MDLSPDGHVTFTDFDGGKIEAIFNKNQPVGKEFLPVKYTDPGGNSTILNPGQPSPDSFIQTIQTYLGARNRVLGEPAATAETPPPQPLGLPAPGNITPPKVEGLIYNGPQTGIPGEEAQYVFTDSKSGGTFYTKNITTENLIRERNRVREKFNVPDILDTMDKGLSFDIIKNAKKIIPTFPTVAAEPIAKALYVLYGTGDPIMFKDSKTGKVMQGVFSEMVEGGKYQVGLPGGDMRAITLDQIISDRKPSGKIAPIESELVGGTTKTGAITPPPELHIPTQKDVEQSAVAGSNITKPTDSYSHAKDTGNVWVRQDVSPQNNDRVLLVQFSTNLINPIEKSVGLDRIYYDKLYSGVRSGFSHPADFWEIPEWIAVASNSLPNSDVYVIRNVDEAVKFFNEAKYGKIAFSVLNVNADMISAIAEKYKGDISVGGYVDLRKQFGRFDNVKTYDKIDQFVRDQGMKFNPGTNYRHFLESDVVPRLMLSSGCLSKCSFCDISPHGKVVVTSPGNVRRQVESIKELKPKLVYISDKTFGQASNYNVLQEISTELKANDPSFEGFVIQTTATQFNRLTDDFIKNSGIKYVELGVETFNDDLLRNYRKPHSTDDILRAFQKARDLNTLVVPNVMIGLQGETVNTYNNTLNFLNANRDIISHVNAYNLAVYAGTDLAEAIGPLQPGDMNENIIQKSWIKDPASNQEFSDKLFNFGIRQLDKSLEQLYQDRTAPAPALAPTPDRIPGFAKHMVFDDDGHLSLRIGSVEDKIAHRVAGGRTELGAISGLVGEVWVDGHTNEVYSQSMYDRKLRGEDIHGIPMDKLDGIQVEGWKSEIAKINPKFDISEKLPVVRQNISTSFDITPSMKESVMQGLPMFRTGQSTAIGMTVDQLSRVVQDTKLKIREGALNLEILNSIEDIPPEMYRETNRRPGSAALGLTFRTSPIPTVYLFANNIKNETEARATIFHEVIGHVGLENLLGPDRLKSFSKSVIDLYGYDNLGYLYRAYACTPGVLRDDHRVALEKIAEIAESGQNPGLWARFVTWFRETLANIFGNDVVGNITEDEIKVYLWRSRELMEQTSIPDMAKIYNSMTSLVSMRMWNQSLPDGPIGLGFQARMDTSPSDESAGRNWSGWRSWFESVTHGQGVSPGLQIPKQLGIVEAIGSLPHWVAMKFKSFMPVTEVEWSRHDKRSKDRLYLMSDTTTNSGDNPYISLKDTTAVDKVITWSDQNDFYLSDDVQLQNKSMELNGRRLTIDEMKAYNGWKGAFDRAIDYAVDKLRQNAMRLYEDQPWAGELRGVINGTVDVNTVILEPDQQREFKRAVILTQERLARVSKLEAGLREMNFYSPHVRGKGDYVVKVLDVGPDGQDIRIWAERFVSAKEAEAGRIRLAREYPDLTVDAKFDPRTTEFIYGQLNVPAMEAFMEKAAQRMPGMNEEVVSKLLDGMYKAIDEEIMARGFRQAYMHRHRGSVIGGYKVENLHQVFFDYMSGLSGSMTKLDATYEFHKALQSIDKVNERGLYEYAVRYVNDMLRNRDSMDMKLNAFKTLPYAWYLSLNLRLAVTQMFQNGVTAYPILARRQQEAGIHGSAAIRLGKAMVDISRNNISEVETRMLREAYEEGETLANNIQELKGKVEGGWAKTYFMKLLDVASIPFAGMERFNRRTSLLAAFRMYTEAGRSYEDAFGQAKEFVRDAHYAYGLSNFPQLLRDGTPFSKIAGMAYVFKSFPHNYVLSMLHYIRNKDGKLALGVMMRSIAMLTILGGLASVPFVDDLLEEYEQLFGDPVRSKMRMALKRYGGDILSQAGMEGLPALAGVDMSGSVKMQIPIPGVGSFDPNTFTMGVWGGLIDKGKKALDFASNSQWSRAIEAASPMGIEMMMKAVRLSQEGLKTAGERPILGQTGQIVMPTPYETGAQIAGFRPERISEIQKERRVAQNIQQQFAKQRADIKKRLRTAKPEDMGSIRSDIEKYNLRTMKYAGIIPRLDIRSTFKPETGYMKYQSVEEGF